MPDEQMAKRHGYAAAQDWHRKTPAPSLRDAAAAVEFRQLQQAITDAKEHSYEEEISDAGEGVPFQPEAKDGTRSR